MMCVWWLVWLFFYGFMVPFKNRGELWKGFGKVFFLVFCTLIQSSVCQHFPVIQLCLPLIVQCLANVLIKHLLVVCFVCIFLVTSFVQRIGLIETWFVCVFSFFSSLYGFFQSLCLNEGIVGGAHRLICAGLGSVSLTLLFLLFLFYFHWKCWRKVTSAVCSSVWLALEHCTWT